jgi:Mrp family chromosome partitioning ATPase
VLELTKKIAVLIVTRWKQVEDEMVERLIDEVGV